MKVITKLSINSIKIDNKTDWKLLKDAEFYCYSIYQNNPYPTYLVSEVEKRYGKQSFEIEISQHKKYKKEQKEMFKAFDYINYEFINGKFEKRRK